MSLRLYSSSKRKKIYVCLKQIEGKKDQNKRKEVSLVYRKEKKEKEREREKEILKKESIRWKRNLCN